MHGRNYNCNCSPGEGRECPPLGERGRGRDLRSGFVGFRRDSRHHGQVYERLLDLDAPLDLVPQLAASWRLVDALTWEFELREGVRFHDGRPFSADDVVFSLERARTPPSKMASYFGKVSMIRALGRHTVQVVTTVPEPLLPMELLQVFIMSKTWAEEHEVTRAADFDAGEETFAVRHANGTGPFILQEFEPGGRIVMVRNRDWWDFERHPHNIDRIEYTPIADPAARLDAVLEGALDLLIDVPFDALDRIKATPGWRLEQAQEPRAIFLGLDQGSAELRSSNVKGRNPFKDVRVRRAMYHAIDMEAIRDGLMRGYIRPAGMLVPPGVNGYSPDLDRRLPHDPARARALLAEAGYPDGFSVTLDCPNNRYVNDAAICRAIAAQFAVVGLDVTVNALPREQQFRKINTHGTDFYLYGLAAATLDCFEYLRLFYQSRSPLNAGFADRRVDELIEKISRETITYGRDALIEEVWRMVLDEVVYLPLYYPVIFWAIRDPLQIPVFPFNNPRLRQARFKETGG